MARPLFAANTVVSERLINRCLTTYLANLVNPRSGSFSVPVLQDIEGATQSVLFDGEFSVISVNATLRPNTQGIIHLTVRLYADATVSAWRTTGPPSLPIATFTPEIVLSTTIDLPLVAQVVGDQFQLGVNLAIASVTSFSVDLFSPSLPNAYQAAVNTALADPVVLAALTAALHGLGFLPSTTALIPAFYEITMERPLSPGQQWFSVRLPVSQLVFQVGFRRLAVGVNVAPFTSASLADLDDHLAPDPDDRRNTVDVATVANLQFLEDFLKTQVFPAMRNEFVAQQLRLNQISSFTFKPIGTRRGFQQGVEVVVDLTYWTDSFIQFNIAGNTKVDARATIHGYPYIQYGRLYFEVNDIDIELPAWITTATIAINFVFPFLGMAVPILMDKLLHDTVADILKSAAGVSTSNSLDLRQELLLPRTIGPLYGMSNVSVAINTDPGFKVLAVSGDFGPPSRILPRLTCNVEEIATQIPADYPVYDIRKIGMLPGFIIVSLFVPEGLFNPKDPSVRVRWEVFFNGKLVPNVGRDVKLRDPSAKELRVIPLLFTNPNRTDQDLAITCRLYRPLGATTDEFINQRINILSIDPRPDDQKPYVKWSHWVKFWNGYKLVDRLRHSAIHKLPGKGGCKFSNQYLNPALRARNKFGSIRHMVDLPFEPVALRQNLDLVCPYCFFGGPDKTPGQRINMTIDLASRVSKADP